LARLAAGQWSVLDTDDLYACGLTPNAIATRVANGRLFRVHRGVYAVIPNLTVRGLLLAGAMVSHFSAAFLYRWFDWDGRYPEVTAVNPRRHAGIRTHRSVDTECVIVHGIPVTSPARTIRDLAGVLSYKKLRRAVNEALIREQIKPVDLLRGGHRGARKLRRILATAAPTRNEYEDLVNELLHQAGIPAPEVNRRRGGFEPDFRRPEQGVLLEADSKRYHGNLVARADDAERQAILEAHGETVVRTTWDEAVNRPNAMVARVREALERKVVGAERD
jgi:very-short-patch-repair endonuclease